MKHRTRAQHCQEAARKHGAYAADKYSVRVYLRLIDLLLIRVEAFVDKSKGAPPSD